MSDRIFTGVQNGPFDSSTDSSIVGNYPPPGDTTSQGGYQTKPDTPDLGLATGQSTEGLSLANQAQDMHQGVDGGARQAYREEMGLNPYGNASADSPEEAADRLASQYTDTRGRQYESGPAAGLENDGPGETRPH